MFFPFSYVLLKGVLKSCPSINPHKSLIYTTQMHPSLVCVLFYLNEGYSNGAPTTSY